MSFETFVCCNARDLVGVKCKTRVEIADDKPPPGWVIVLGTRAPTVDDVLASKEGRVLRAIMESANQLGPGHDAPGIRTAIEQMMATALEAAPRVELEAHLCPRHAESMPSFDWKIAPPE